MPSQQDPDPITTTGALQAEPPAPHAEQPWLEDLEELPARPRRRLLAPAPLALLAVLVLACGFIAGVLVEKGQGGTAAASPATSAFAARLRGLPGSGRGPASSAAGAGLFGAGAGAQGRPTSGTMSYAANGTLYVTDGEGNTVKVKTSAATTVTKTVKSSVHAIHPGETVTVTGTAAANGTVSAEAIRVGGGSGAGLAGLFGAGGAGGNAGGSGSGAAGSSAGAGPSTEKNGGPALFGSG